MLFVLTITFWALIKMTWSNWQQAQGMDAAMFNSLASLALLVLAVYLVIRGIFEVRSSTR
jgi:uncharacterized membrane protein YphA (DoxX/SURF4 family)